jgi:polyhydroxybutyrate depolymerase
MGEHGGPTKGPGPIPIIGAGLLLAIVVASCSSGASNHAGSAPRTQASLPSTTTTVEINVATKPLAARRDAYVFRLAFGGHTRDVRLHVPPAAATGRPLPLILNLHGATQNGFLEEAQTGMDASSDRDGYLVAYPDGTRIATKLTPDPVAKDAQYGWNAGYCCGLPVTKHVDDVGFLLAVISDIATRTPVNLRRVYVTGISNGGMMAYAMAADASDRIAAIASVEGQVELPAINPARPVPTLEYHSVNDPVAKWDGVPSKDPDLRFSVMSGVDQWVKADGCEPTPHAQAPIVGAAGSRSAGETATLVTYQSCRDGSAVRLWRFTGSGHVWPGAPFNTGPRKTWILDGVGRGITLVNANDDMWRFFERHELADGAQ